MPERALLPPDVGPSDYLIHIVARDLHDFQRLHARVLGHLPGVARIESKFALRRPSTARWCRSAEAPGTDDARPMTSSSSAARCMARRSPIISWPTRLRRQRAADREGPELPVCGDRALGRLHPPAVSSPINIEISLYGIEFLRSVGDLLEVDGERPDDRAHRRRLSVPRPRRRRRARRSARNHALQASMGADIVHLDPAASPKHVSRRSRPDEHRRRLPGGAAAKAGSTAMG